MRALCSVIFACWVSMEGQFVAIVARRASAADWALHRVLGLYCLEGAIL